MTEKNEALFETHGVSPDYTEAQAEGVARATLIALGAATRISAREMDRFVAIATEYGATPDMIERWRKFDYESAQLADQIEMTPRLARHMMYDAIRIVRAATPQGPCPKLTAVARALGVNEVVAKMLDAVASADLALRGMRAGVEEATRGRPGGMPPGAVGGLASITEQVVKLRELRIKTMEEESPFPS